MNNFFLFFIFSISCLAAVNIDEKMNPAYASSINPSNPIHRLMQHPTQNMLDYFKYIRTQLVTMLLEDTDTLYPKALSALARTNQAWAQTVREVTDKVFTSDGKVTLAQCRPHIKWSLMTFWKYLVSPNRSSLLLDFSKITMTNKKTIKLIFNRLLHGGVDLNNQNFFRYRPALHNAAHVGNTQIVKLLLDAGTDKDCRDKYGFAPLHLAACEGHTEIVKLLLDAGTDKDCRCKYGFAPLHLAAREGHTEIVRLLLDANANKDCRNYIGKTPLHFASYKGDTGTVKLLLDGANKDNKGNDGWTPLHNAACEGHTEIVKLLLNAGADKDCRDYDDETPLHWAAHNGHTEIVKLLS